MRPPSTATVIGAPARIELREDGRDEVLDEHDQSRSRPGGGQGWLVFYSPKTSLDDGERLQAFTAIGQVADDEPYQTEVAPGFVPWRRNVEFVDCVETPIQPLIDSLSFIEDKQRWGSENSR
jgi:hypothetical protein